MTLMDGNGGTFRVGDMSFQCFDIHSSKEPQFGFMATFANGLRLCCLGDEPFTPPLAVNTRRTPTG